MTRRGSSELIMADAEEQDNGLRLFLPSLSSDGLLSVVVEIILDEIAVCFNIVGRSISSKPQRKSDE